VPDILILCSLNNLKLKTLTEGYVVLGHYYNVIINDLKFPICQQKSIFCQKLFSCRAQPIGLCEDFRGMSWKGQGHHLVKEKDA